jgi:tetratricopeptide (TPR) repeat protein
MVNHGEALHHLDRAVEALGTYDDVITRYSDDNTPAIREQVATALVAKGTTLRDSQRPEEAIELYSEAIARYSDDNTPAIREQVATAMVNHGEALHHLDRAVEALGTYDDVITRYSDDNTPAIREQVATALVAKGTTLWGLEPSEETVRLFAEILTQESGKPSSTTAIGQQAATSLHASGLLPILVRFGLAVCVLDEAVTRYGDDPEPTIREQVAKALMYRSTISAAIGLSEQAVETYSEIITRYGNDTEPAIREQVATALVAKGTTLWGLEPSEETIQEYTGLFTHDSGNSSFVGVFVTGIYQQILISLDAAGLLPVFVRFGLAVCVLDEAVTRYGDDPEPAIREQVAKALMYRSTISAAIGLSEQAVETYSEIITRYGNDTEPAIREQVATARAAKCVVRAD